MSHLPGSWSQRVALTSGVVLALGSVGPTALAQGTEPPEITEQLVTLGASTTIEPDALAGENTRTDISAAGTTVESEGQLELTPSTRGRPLTRFFPLDEPWPVLRVEGTARIDPAARAGLMCGSATTDRAATVGLVFSSGALIGHLGPPSGWQEGARVPHGQPFDGETTMAVECATDDAGVEHVALWMDGELILEAEFADSYGPYAQAGASAESAEPPDAIGFRDVSIHGGDAYLPGVSGGTLTSALILDFEDVADLEPYDDGAASITYSAGAAHIGAAGSGTSFWSWDSLVSASPSMRIDSSLSIEGDGVAGLMCGEDTEDPDFIIGVVTASGDAAIGHLIEGDVSILEFVSLPPDVDIGQDKVFRLALDCLSRPGGERAQLWLDGRLVSETWIDGGIGPFIHAGEYVEGDSGPIMASFDLIEIAIGE